MTDAPLPKINETIRIPIEKLEPFDLNPNVMSDADFGRLVLNIREHGFDEPLQVVQKGEKYTIIGGMHRWKACKLLGFTELPCVVYPWNDKQAMEECVRRNLIRGRLDHEKYGQLLAEWLQGETDLNWKRVADAFAVKETDIFKAMRSNDQLQDLVQSLKEVDAIPEPKSETSPISQIGDIWKLGDHQLMCGDSTKSEDMAKLMGEERASLIIIDSPESFGKEKTGKKKKDENPSNFWEFLKEAFSNCAAYTLPRTAWYVWHSRHNRSAIEDALAFINVKIHQMIVWVKPKAVLSYSFFPQRHEPCAFGYKEGEAPPSKLEDVVYFLEAHDEAIFGWKKNEKSPHKIDRSKHLTSVWEVDYDGKQSLKRPIHPSQKPVRIFEIPMIHHTEMGQICLDPFAGSGSQIIAAERLKRKCYAMEINPAYVDISICRWQTYVGRKAECLTRKVEIPLS